MKKAIVIGATSGIGKELARLLTSNNYTVGITDTQAELLQELKQESPDSYFTEPLDILETDLTVAKLDKLANRMGGLDLVVINSGTGNLNETLNFKLEKLAIDTEVIAFTCVADWAFNYFLKQRSGHLIAISFIGEMWGGLPTPSDSAIKAYQVDYLKSLQQKARKLKQPIYISDIRPGLVNTTRAKGKEWF